jgi:hypothetical protein
MRFYFLLLACLMVGTPARADDFEFAPLGPPSAPKKKKPAPKSDEMDFAVPLGPASPAPKKPAPRPAADPIDLIPLVPLAPASPAPKKTAPPSRR